MGAVGQEPETPGLILALALTCGHFPPWSSVSPGGTPRPPALTIRDHTIPGFLGLSSPSPGGTGLPSLLRVTTGHTWKGSLGLPALPTWKKVEKS